MGINELLIKILSPIVKKVVPDNYTGTEPEYITFNYSEIPDCFGDDVPGDVINFVQVHLYLPLKSNCLIKKKSIAKALFKNDFTFPTITNATDSDYQHYVFECQYAEGGDLSGQF